MTSAGTTRAWGHFLSIAFSQNNTLPLSPPVTPLALPWPQPLLMFNPPDRTTREVSPGGVVTGGGTPPGTGGGTCVPAAVSVHLRKPPG